MNKLAIILQVSTHKEAAEFAKLDPYGIGMTMVAMSVVFASLLVLYLLFKNIAKLFAYDFKKKTVTSINPIENKKNQATLELGAAVAMALHLYQQELHDHEAALLTIKKINRSYSPWSSKIYGMRKELK
jgi:glutaconyl-CoA/methylmalonyl-CoA decarboxylase subunit delta